MGMYFVLKPGWPAIVGACLFIGMAAGWAVKIFSPIAAIEVLVCAAILTGLVKILADKGVFRSETKEDEALLLAALKPGDTGSAITTLNPNGNIRINGHRFKARCTSTSVPANYPVEVAGIEQDTVIVEPRR